MYGMAHDCATFLTGALTLIYMVTETAFLPALVPGDQLVMANGRLSASASVADIAGPGLAAVLIQLVTAPLAIVGDALSFLASALLIHSLPASQ
jgi:hypothetical protein